MHRYGLIKVNYNIPNDGIRRRESIALTNLGKSILNNDKEEATPVQEPSRDVTITSVKRDIDKLRQIEPDLEILFEIRLKESWVKLALPKNSILPKI
jgi:hypothetical protein